MTCELFEFGACGGRMDKHHLLNRAKLRNIPGAMAYCEKNADVLLADVCHLHHMLFADAAWVRAYLLRCRIERLGVRRVRRALEGLRALTKSRPPEFRLEAILAAEEA